ncbi:hypothetical protein HZS_1943, partial [Henneguya salminicola]
PSPVHPSRSSRSGKKPPEKLAPSAAGAEDKGIKPLRTVIRGKTPRSKPVTRDQRGLRDCSGPTRAVSQRLLQSATELPDPDRQKRRGRPRSLPYRLQLPVVLARILATRHCQDTAAAATLSRHPRRLRYAISRVRPRFFGI